MTSEERLMALCADYAHVTIQNLDFGFMSYVVRLQDRDGAQWQTDEPSTFRGAVTMAHAGQVRRL